MDKVGMGSTPRLVKLECGHEVLASSATAHTIRCAVCKKLVPVEGRRV